MVVGERWSCGVYEGLMLEVVYVIVGNFLGVVEFFEVLCGVFEGSKVFWDVVYVFGFECFDGIVMVVELFVLFDGEVGLG